MGVQEMNVKEMKDGNGGSVALVILTFAVGFVGGYLFGKEHKEDI